MSQSLSRSELQDGTTVGALRRLRACSTPSGRFVVVANDHRSNLRRALRPSAPDAVTAAELAGFKQAVVAALSPGASAVLVDPEFGLAAAVVTGALDPQAGLIVALEETGYGDDGEGRVSRLLPDWGVEKSLRVGAEAAKLLVYYHPDAPAAGAQEQLVERVALECRTRELPLFLEPLSYSLDPGRRLSSAERRAVVVETARRLTPLGADVLKAEFPVDPAEQPDEAAWAEACEELTAASATPWVLLSAGVTFDDFLRQTRVACAAGASGILAGRAVWAEATSLEGDERRRFLDSTARARLDALAAVVEETARPWPELARLPQPAESWFATY